MISKRNHILTAILAILVGTQALAADEPVVEIDKIVIKAPAAEESPTPQTPSTQIKVPRQAPVATTVSDLVGRSSGVHILNHGGLEAATSVSIRGSSHAQVEVYLDEVPIQTAGGEGVGLEHFAVSSLERIEIFKSFTPGEFGASAIGGVISLQSKPVAKGFHHAYGLGFGSFTTIFGHAEASYGGSKSDILFKTDFRSTEGNFTYLDDNGTPLNSGDDQTAERQNNEALIVHPYLKWQHRFDDRSMLTITNHFFRMDSGVPGLQNFQSQTAGRSLSEWLGQVKFERGGYFDGRFSLANTSYWRLIKSQFSDLNGEIGLGAGQDNDNDTVVFGNRLLGAASVADFLILKPVAEYVVERFQPRDYLAADSIGSASVRQQLNLTLEPDFLFWDGRFTLSTQLRLVNAFYDINNDDPSLAASGTFFDRRVEHPWLAHAAANLEAFPGFFLKASGGRAVRLPKFSELFGDQGYVLGNAQLESETSLKFDGGVLYKKSLEGVINHWRVEANYFEMHTDNLIQFELANGLARAANLGEARVRGVEFVLSARLLKYFEVTQNYTWQRSHDEAVNPGNFLIGRPEHEFNTGLTFDKKPFHAGVFANFIDNQYLDSLNTQRVDDRLRWDTEASYTFKDKVLFGLELKNITGTQIVDAVGFPLPGRSIFGRVEAEF